MPLHNALIVLVIVLFFGGFGLLLAYVDAIESKHRAIRKKNQTDNTDR